ncbi:phage minor capsid protein [Kitasatospora sp. NPDC050543]|uniref:phage minor capsid protein n=1 Tax=Kitasatospora sp. NPDC050543 TaxID=3364054 RepID=UPI00379BC7A9
MPVSPADGEAFARAIGVLYEEAEQVLLGTLRDALAQGIELPRWAELKLAAVGNLRSAVEEVTAALQQDATGAIGQAVAAAYERGGQAAVAELGMLPEGLRAAAERELPNARSVDRLAAAAVAEQQPVYRRILRVVQDTYRGIIGRVSAGPLTGVNTRRQATQRALDQFAQRGITGFTDRAGRNWDMASYAEMAARSVTGRAAIQGHTDRLQAIGQRLVIVSDAPLECPLCRPWEGEILTLDEHRAGPQVLTLADARHDGVTHTVHVAGSLTEARAAGLMHPNCRHSLSLYLPGVTSRPSSPPHPGGATYKDTQQQRYYERQVRLWKRRAAVAIDDQATRLAGQKVRVYQSRIRELTSEKQLPRKRTREQIGAAR